MADGLLDRLQAQRQETASDGTLLERLRKSRTPEEAGNQPPAPQPLPPGSDNTTLQNIVGGITAFSQGVLEGVPFVGGFLKEGAARASALLEAENLDESIERARAVQKVVSREFGGTETAGRVVGAVAGTAPLVAAAPGAFGVTQMQRARQLSQSARQADTAIAAARLGGLAKIEGLKAAGASAASGAAISGIDTAIRTGDAEKAGTAATTGAVVGAIAPAIAAKIAGGVSNVFPKTAAASPPIGPPLPRGYTSQTNADASRLEVYRRGEAVSAVQAAPSAGGDGLEISITGNFGRLMQQVHESAVTHLEGLTGFPAVPKRIMELKEYRFWQRFDPGAVVNYGRVSAQDISPTALAVARDPGNLIIGTRPYILQGTPNLQTVRFRTRQVELQDAQNLQSTIRQPNAPTAEDLQTTARVMYSAAESAGVRVQQATIENVLKRMQTRLQREGLIEEFYPQITRFMKIARQRAAGGSISLREVENLRSIGRELGAGQNTDKNLIRFSSIINDELKMFIRHLGPTDLTQGRSARESVQLIQRARNLWTTQAKAESIQAVVTKAEQRPPSKSYADSLQDGFRTLSRNRVEMLSFSPQERSAIRELSKSRSADRFLRVLSNYMDPRYGLVYSTFGAGAGFSLGGVVGAAAVPATGAAATLARNAKIQRSVDKLDTAVRAGRFNPSIDVRSRAPATAIVGGVTRSSQLEE